MRADFKVVLDACVLANFGVGNLLLRLAENPRLYLPRFSQELLAETKRTQIDKLGWNASIAESFHSKLVAAFPESLVEDYEHLVDGLANDPKDRHVLACAIHSKAELIVTFNLKDFPKAALEHWHVEAQQPQDWLLNLFSIEPVVVLHKLEQIARKRNVQLEDHLIQLGHFVPMSLGRTVLLFLLPKNPRRKGQSTHYAIHVRSGRRTPQPDTSSLYRRLVLRGKPAKAALTAVMRKLVILANRVLREPDFQLA